MRQTTRFAWIDTSPQHLTERLDHSGFVQLRRLLDATALARLINGLDIWAGRGGRRRALDQQEVRRALTHAGLSRLLTGALGEAAVIVRAIYFDKHPRRNWHVSWHQDRVLAFATAKEAPGFGPWTEKDGQACAPVPLSLLESMLALRLELDGSSAESGALRVLPGTHRGGVLDPAETAAHVRSVEPVVCSGAAGDAVLMRPLLLHSSSRMRGPGIRRVLHLECAPGPAPAGRDWRWQIGCESPAPPGG